MRLPELSQHDESRLGEWDVTVFSSLASVHMHHHAFRVDVADLQAERLVHAKPE